MQIVLACKACAGALVKPMRGLAGSARLSQHALQARIQRMLPLMQELKSEADRKAEEIDRLRAAEKFMTKVRFTGKDVEEDPMCDGGTA